MRVVRHGGPSSAGGQPYSGPPMRRLPCPNCDAAVGQPCVTYRVHKGVRLYVRGTRSNYHPERIAAVHAATKPPSGDATP